MKKFFKINSEGEIKDFKLEKREERGNDSFSYLKYFGFGFYLITPFLACLLLGLYLKKVLFFIFLGTFFTFYNLIRITKE